MTLNSSFLVVWNIDVIIACKYKREKVVLSLSRLCLYDNIQLLFPNNEHLFRIITVSLAQVPHLLSVSD